MNNFPIGIIDSGSGGLSIWKEVSSLLPYESTIYIGDHKYLPYSDKSTTFIRHRVAKLIQFLIKNHVKLIVIACNTATVAGIDWYRLQFSAVPIIGVVPVVKTAALITKKHAFCVLSTKYTAKSTYQKRLIKTFAPNDTVFVKGSELLVSAIESQPMNTHCIEGELKRLLTPSICKLCDVLVLGCTHYPFIRSHIQHIVGSMSIIDSGGAVARQVERILVHNDIQCVNSKTRDIFITTGDAKKFQRSIHNLLGLDKVVVPVTIQ